MKENSSRGVRVQLMDEDSSSGSPPPPPPPLRGGGILMQLHANYSSAIQSDEFLSLGPDDAFASVDFPNPIHTTK